MKTIYLFYQSILILTIAYFISCSSETQITRIQKKIDFGWKFHRGDFTEVESMESMDFDISGWREVDLPHDWSIENIPGTTSPFDSSAISGSYTGFAVGGTSWYVKDLTLGKEYKNKIITILFEGVYLNSEVWINGHYLGNHPHGQTSFFYDLTKYIKFNGFKNRLAIRVKNEGINNGRYTGSGIYRHVWLTAANPVSIAQWGTFIKTKDIDNAKAQLEITTDLQNQGKKDKTVVLKLQALNSEGSVVGETEKEITIPANKTIQLNQDIQIKSPELWSVEDPNLYKLKSLVIQHGKPIDETANTFGIRMLTLDPHKGFILNGKVTKLKGGCMHKNNGPLGACAYDHAEERRVVLMKANGFNAIRTAHNPPSPAFLNACDSIGMLVLDEFFNCWFYDSRSSSKKPYHQDPFENLYKKDVESTVKRDRNHPSVILWSTGNENMNKMDPRAWKIQREFVKYLHELDPTRAVTCGANRWGNEDWNIVLENFISPLDVAGYNYQAGQYEEDFKKYPNRLIVATETPIKNMFEYLMKMEEHHYVIGDFTWTGFDYLGEAGTGWEGPAQGNYPWTVAYCGDIDLCGFKRPQSYYREIIWGTGKKVAAFVKKPEPTFEEKKSSWWSFDDVYACWTWPGYEKKDMQVDVYSRCEKVTLQLNGEKIGTKETNKKNKFTASFKVPYQEGTLKASAYNGKELIDTFTIQTVKEPVKLKLTADRTNIKANNQDLSYITVELADEKDLCSPFAQRLVEFDISGPGEIIAAGSSNPKSVESFQLKKRTTFQGRCIAIVKSTKDKGTITVSAKSKDLPDNQISIVSE